MFEDLLSSSTQTRETGISLATTVGIYAMSRHAHGLTSCVVPVFFIQDAIKFPDIIHAVKPEPQNEVPQGQSAHNNFWDFVGLQPECESCSRICLSDLDGAC